MSVYFVNPVSNIFALIFLGTVIGITCINRLREKGKYPMSTEAKARLIVCIPLFVLMLFNFRYL